MICTRVSLALALLTVVVSAGCTADAEPASQRPTRTTVSPQPESSLPDCTDVWHTDARLPTRYDGCTAAGTVVVPVLLACKDGGSLTSYRDRLYAVTGRRITSVHGDMATDRRYARAYSDCLGQADTADPPPATATPTPPPPTATVAGPSAYQDGHIWLTTELEGLDVPEVRIVQAQLNAVGFPVVVDGSYGPQTAGAVSDFQRVYGLTVDGIVGPETYTAMFQYGD